MEVIGTVKSGWRKFYSKTQLPRLVQKGGGVTKKKRRSTTRKKYQDIQKQQEGQDPEEGRKEPRDN